MTGKYLEQYERMKRSYERFAAIKQGRPHDLPSVNYEDEVYAFFLNCYHLKDWIKNDSTVRAQLPTISAEVEYFINDSEPLSLSADLCNSLKHLANSNRSGEDPSFGRKLYHFTLHVGQGSSIKLDWLVEREKKKPIDAFELATQCVAAWDQFLSSKKLK
jgi:hypothetical protein